MPKKNKRGTPSKFTPALAALYVEQIRSGLGLDEACHIIGIDRGTRREWEEAHPAFSLAIKKAQTKFEQDQLTVIREAAVNRYDREGRLTRKGSWTASAWLLERKWPDRYGERWSGELSGKGGKPLIPEGVPQVDTSHFSKEQLDQLIAATTPAAAPLPTTPTETNGHPLSNGDS